MNPPQPVKDTRSHQLSPVAPPLVYPKPMLWSRRIAGMACSGLLLLAFAPTLFALASHVATSELHSYILLIPFVAGYLLYVHRNQLPEDYSSAPGWSALAALAGIAALAGALVPDTAVQPLSENDYLALMTLSFLCFLVAGGFFFLGRKWMKAVAFPVAFLCFMIPMPDAMANALETASQLASAEAANLFFTVSDAPFLRQGMVFQLPNIVIEVAQECSGIRSSWILFITSLIASNLFLRTPWRRAALVAFVIPLGILRNGFRILVIGLLCVHVGPEMIRSVIHLRGGPLFFAVSLIPFSLLLWWLRRGESKRTTAAGIRGGIGQ